MADAREIKGKLHRVPFDEVIRRAVPALRKPSEYDNDPPMEGTLQATRFKGKDIRQSFHNNEWFFSIVDVVASLTTSENPRRYWSDLKRKLFEQEGFSELYDRIVQLKMPGADNKMYETDVANVETVLRIVQSIPSPKAEPFKKWLAKVGFDRVQEFHNPEVSVRVQCCNGKCKAGQMNGLRTAYVQSSCVMS